jgi:CheY-like chemotaxis protein
LLVLVVDMGALAAARQQAEASGTALQSLQQQHQQAMLEAERSRLRLVGMGSAISGQSLTVVDRLRDLADMALGAAQRMQLALAGAEAQALHDLPAELDDRASAALGRLQLAPRPFRLEELLRELATLLAARRRDSSVELVFALGPNLPDYLLGDLPRLRQVLMQLAGNALKYTQAGEVVLELQRLPTEASGQVALRFALRDSGVGIAESRREQLFDSGQGLAYCRQVLGLMGSELELLSQPGVGSEFSFELELPLQPGEPLPRLPVQRVLLVEPQAASRAALLALLHEQGAQVVAAADAAQARQALAAEPRFDLLWVATRLPDGEGWSCAQLLRQQHLTRHGGRPPRWLLCGADLRAGSEQEPEGFALKPLSAGMIRDALAVGVEGVGGATAEQTRDGATSFQPLRVPVAQQQRALALGLDLQTGIDRFLGRSGLYLRTASAFAAQAQRLPEQLREQMARRPPNWAAAQDALHSFKGLAATLAFERLAHWGRVGEQRVRGGQALDEEWLDSLALQLGEGLAMLLSEAQALHQPPLPPVMATVAAPTLLAALHKGVEARDPGVQQLFAGQRQTLAPWLGDDLQALDEALAALDFEAAKALLDARQGLAAT